MLPLTERHPSSGEVAAPRVKVLARRVLVAIVLRPCGEALGVAVAIAGGCDDRLSAIGCRGGQVIMAFFSQGACLAKGSLCLAEPALAVETEAEGELRVGVPGRRVVSEELEDPLSAPQSGVHISGVVPRRPSQQADPHLRHARELIGKLRLTRGCLGEVCPPFHLLDSGTCCHQGPRQAQPWVGKTQFLAEYIEPPLRCLAVALEGHRHGVSRDDVGCKRGVSAREGMLHGLQRKVVVGVPVDGAAV
jgi:hypothetical protein